MISPLAYVNPSAKIGQNVTIHPFAYIDENVEIGDGCEIMSYTSIIHGTRMGKNNKYVTGLSPAALRRSPDISRHFLGHATTQRPQPLLLSSSMFG